MRKPTGRQRPPSIIPAVAGCDRRLILKALALGGAGLRFGAWPVPAAGQATPPSLPELSGTDFDLVISEDPLNITGRPRTGILVNGSLPAPLLRWREGDTVTLRVRNATDEPTSIHWHGVILPAAMDGVPGLSFAGIEPGETFTYRFPVHQSGTYWYHSHSRMQEQRGLYGPIVIEPRGVEPVVADRDYVVVLSDWTDTDPHHVLALLRKESDYFNFHQRTVGDFLRDVERDGFAPTMAERRMWADMRMNPTDLSDVSAEGYSYLMNGRTAAGNWTGLFRPGERVRLRFINAAAMTLFDVRIPGLPMTVVAADGQPVEPVAVDEFRIGNAETFDVIVAPATATAFTLFAQTVDRTGFVRGTLTADPVAMPAAAVPAPDPRPILTMADMGHGPVAATAGHDEHAHHQGHGAADPAIAITHAPTEYGPGVDMRADHPSPALDDPGVGLRGNGRRVLTYADLRSHFPDPDGREPSRTIELHLTGHMDRYMWSFNGVKFSAAGLIQLEYGERVRFLIVNDTMMEHPVHLHGMWSDLESEDGRFQVRKHTVRVRPGQVLRYRVSADALGRWAYHCHLAFHMDTGMFRVVQVDVPGTAPDGGHQHG